MGRKEIRQKQLLKLILEHGGVPSTERLAEELGVTVRTIQNDLHDVAEMIPEVATEEIEKALFLRIKQRLPEFSDLNLLRLLEYYKSKKSEAVVKTEGDLVFKLETWRPEKDGEDAEG